MAIQNVTAGRSAAEQLSARPELRISRPLAPDERDTLWARYAALLKKARRTTKDDDELFSVRQRLGVSDTEHAVLPEILEAGERLDAAQREMEEAQQRAEEAENIYAKIKVENHRLFIERRKMLETAEINVRSADANHNTARRRTNQLRDLRAVFGRLFGSDPATCPQCADLPVDLSNRLRASGDWLNFSSTK